MGSCSLISIDKDQVKKPLILSKGNQLNSKFTETQKETTSIEANKPVYRQRKGQNIIVLKPLSQNDLYQKRQQVSVNKNESGFKTLKRRISLQL